MQKALSQNPFPGPHTFISIPNAVTAFIVGLNGERLRRLHQQTGAYIFVPKDYNALTDERVIQVSGNERAVATCREEIHKVVEEIAPLLKIDLIEFRATKKVIEDNFKKIIKQQQEGAKKKKALNEN
jgi:hypothetical protein